VRFELGKVLMTMPSRRWTRLARATSVALLSASGAVALLPTAASAATGAIIDDVGCTTSSMGLNDDNSTGSIPLSSTLKFYDRDVSQTQVSNNGFFHMDNTYSSWIAPFNTDLDSRYTGTPVTYGEMTFEGHPALCANWFSIGYYSSTASTVDVQGLLVDRSDLQAGDFDVVFNYGRIGGTSPYGPLAGFFSYDETTSAQNSYYLPGSGQPGAFDDSNTETGLIHGSRESEVLGRYIFRFRNGQPVGIAAPDTTIATQPETPSNDTSPSFTYTSSASEEHERFECRVTAADVTPGAFETCPDDGITYADLTEGSYTFEVRAVDSSANTDDTPASATFTIDTTGPDTEIGTTPAVYSNDTTPTFGWSSEATDLASFECNLNRTESAEESPWYACDAEEDGTLTTLGDGDWTFQVRGIDELGNVGEAESFDFTVDTAPSVTSIDTAPASLGNDPTPSFTYSADPSVDLEGFECRLFLTGEIEPAAFEACDDAGFESQELGDGDGDYTFEVRALDTAGNVGDPASYDFTIDTVAGDTAVTSAPEPLSNVTTPSFTYSSDASDLDYFECRLVGGASPMVFEHCDDSGTPYGPLADGDYAFEVRSVDLAGNPDPSPAVNEFTVDTVAPETTIGKAPAATVGTDSVTFGFASDKDPSSFECRLSGGQAAAWQPCAGTSKTFTGLVDGDYLFEVRATDAAGNTDATPATGKVRVNVGRPTITAALSSEFPISAAGWHRAPVTITYTCAGNSSALVGACPAPRLVPRAQRGRTFRASITTADGDTASVSTTLYIDKGRPKAEIKGFSGQKTYSSVPDRIRCVASDPRSGLDTCTIKVTKVTHKDGERFIVVRAKATDLAGNVRVVTKQAPFRAA
jgi:hypothetical protein